MEKFILTKIDLQLFSEDDTYTDSSGVSNDTGDSGFDLASLLGDTDQQDNQQAIDQDNQVDTTGGEKTFTQAEIDRIVVERLNRERQKYQGFESTQQQLQRLQEHGYSLDDIVGQLEQYQLQQQAEESGLPEQAVKKLNDYEQRLAYFERQEGVRRIQAEEERLTSDKEFGEFFTQNIDEIYNIAKNDRTNLETAMGKLFIRKYPEIRQQQLQAGQQQAIRQIQQRGNTLVDGATQSGDVGGIELSNEQLAIAKSLGVNPRDYAKYMKKK